MFIQRIIGMMVGVVLLCTMPTIAMAQDFKVNHQQLAGYNSCNRNYIPCTSNRDCYTAITHTMPSMSQPSNCSTVLGGGSFDANNNQNTGNPNGPRRARRVSEYDHNPDPFIPIGDIPWGVMVILIIAYVAYFLIRAKHAQKRLKI